MLLSHIITTFFDRKSGQGWGEKGHKKRKKQKARRGERLAPRAVVLIWVSCQKAQCCPLCSPKNKDYRVERTMSKLTCINLIGAFLYFISFRVWKANLIKQALITTIMNSPKFLHIPRNPILISCYSLIAFPEQDK